MEYKGKEVRWINVEIGTKKGIGTEISTFIPNQRIAKKILKIIGDDRK